MVSAVTFKNLIEVKIEYLLKKIKRSKILSNLPSLSANQKH